MKTKTLNNATSAALSGHLNLSREKYRKYFIKSRVSVLMASALPWCARFFPYFGENIVHWTRIKEHLENGCLTPVRVISMEKALAAAFTNLNAVGERSIPVIKIFRERLDLVPSEKLYYDASFAAASLF